MSWRSSSKAASWWATAGSRRTPSSPCRSADKEREARRGDRQRRDGPYLRSVVDLTRETDIEQLRRVAIAQQIQIEQLLRVLRAKCDELAALKGSETELQQTLSLVEDLSRQAQTVASQLAELPRDAGSRRQAAQGARQLRPHRAARVAHRGADLRAGCRRRDVPELRRSPRAHEGAVRDERDDRRSRGQLPRRARAAAEVRLQVRRLHRDRPRTRARHRRRTLLARRRHQGRHRQVPRPHPARPPGAHPSAPRPDRHYTDALGPAPGAGATSGVGIPRPARTVARRAGDRPGSDELAPPGRQRRHALADVVPDLAGRRGASHPRRQERQHVP